jgi:hypothetical protein
MVGQQGRLRNGCTRGLPGIQHFPRAEALNGIASIILSGNLKTSQFDYKLGKYQGKRAEMIFYM